MFRKALRPKQIPRLPTTQTSPISKTNETGDLWAYPVQSLRVFGVCARYLFVAVKFEKKLAEKIEPLSDTKVPISPMNMLPFFNGIAVPSTLQSSSTVYEAHDNDDSDG